MSSDPTHSSLVRFDMKLKAILGGEGSEPRQAESEFPFPKIDRYSVIDVLPSGGQSFVYLANDTQLQRRVVLKFCKDALNEERKQQVILEGRALSKVRCSSICNCYDVGEFDGHPYLVLEYIPGDSLQKVVDQKQHSQMQALHLFRSIVECLVAVHQAGLVHRDIKPGNILIDHEGRIRLIDFGLTRQVGNDSTDEVSGTPAYLSPEQVNGDLEHIDVRTDIFGAGTVFYHLLTGQPPYTGETRAEVIEKARKAEFVSPSEINPAITQDVEAICLKCMSLRPADRYSSAEELARAVDSCVSPKGSFKKPLIICGVALLLLIVASVVFQNVFFPATVVDGSESQESKSKERTRQPELSQVPRGAIKLLEEIVSSGKINDRRRRDFEVEVSISGKKLPRKAVTSAVQHLDLGETYSLLLKSERDCYVGILSVECSPDSAVVDQLVAVYPNEYIETAIFLEAGDSESYEIRAKTISKTTEFLLVIASTEKWSPGELKSWFESKEGAKPELQTGELWRGLEAAGKNHLLVFEKVVPYWVE